MEGTKVGEAALLGINVIRKRVFDTCRRVFDTRERVLEPRQ